MKKLIAAILTAFLMSAGLVAGASSPAAAACPYTNCVATGTTAIGLKARAPHKAKVYVKVSSFGNGKPRGTLTFTFVDKRGRSFTFTRPYPKRHAGKKGVFNFKPLHKGKYNVVVTFNPRNGSVYEGSGDSTKVKVKGGRRR